MTGIQHSKSGCLHTRASPSKDMPLPDDNDEFSISAFKRRIDLLEEENHKLHGVQASSTKMCYNKYLSARRLIRRIVSLNDRIEDLVNEADCHACMVEFDSDDTVEHSEEEERLYRCYQELLRWIPSLKTDLATESEDYEVHLIMRSLTKGTDSACGDDAARLKMAIVGWLMGSQKTPELALDLRSKTGRGFYHDATARLICPVDYNWSNAIDRAHICNFHPDYLVTANSWPHFLYKDEIYDPKDPVKGLFKNKLLVQAFKHIFTSPSSADVDSVADDTDDEIQASTSEPPLKRRKGPTDKRTRSNVVSLIGMKSITPRAIAYTAVQVKGGRLNIKLQFALSSCMSWRIVDEDFNYEAFYNNIASFFEDCYTEQEKVETAKLLLWWNRSVFGHMNTSTYRPQAMEKMSVASTLRKRRRGAAWSG
ncbi:hypothetical protein EDD17DRAFT_1506196 [Pisolithus thermaeus]|nr:hypothetical protein EDD17DRAFT_1506196 [Pisolithus thermaeus]